MSSNDNIKIAAIFICIAEVIIFGGMPIYIPQARKGSVLGLLNSFSGGVLLAIGMQHLLQESVIRFEEHVDDVTYPLPFFLCVVSFSFLLIFHNLFGMEHDHEQDDEKHEHKRLETNNEFDNQVPAQQANQNELANNNNQKEQENGNQQSTNQENNQNNQQQQSQGSQEEQKNAQEVELAQINIEEKESKNGQLNGQAGNNIQLAPTASQVDVPEFEEIREVKYTLIGLVLAATLTAYGLMFGIILGMSSNYDDTAILVAGLCGHKWADAMSLSINQAKDRTKRLTIILCQVLLLVASPLGILIGMGISSTDAVTEAVLMALCSGLILYVSTADIIAEEFESESNMKKKLICFLIGIVVIAVFLQFYVEHEVSEEEVH